MNSTLIALIILLLAAFTHNAVGTPAASGAQTPEMSGAQAVTPTNIRSWPDPGMEGGIASAPSPGSDFAAFVNQNWYASTVIPDGYSSWTRFAELELSIEKAMIETLSAPDLSADQQKAAALFASARNMDARGAAGLGPFKDAFDAIINAGSLAEISALLESDALMLNYSGLFSCCVMADNRKSDINVACIKPPSLSLGDSAEYGRLTAQGERCKSANDRFYKALLTHNGVSAEKADQMLCDLYDLETRLAKGVYPVKTSYREDYQTLIYNEYSPLELAELASGFPAAEVLRSVGLSHAKRFIVEQPESLKTLGSLYTEKNLAGIKAYAAVNLLSATAGFCDAYSDSAAVVWNNEMYGSSGHRPDDVRALSLCSGMMEELLGRIYAKKYFNSASKADIVRIVGMVKEAFKQRLAGADWLTEQTRRTAVEKLDAMTLRIGCADVFRYDWDAVKVYAYKPLIENAAAIAAEKLRQDYALADKPVDKNLWAMGAHIVNAYYSPSDNSINFPAAILQPPFYDADGSQSANLGGIGAFSAHEITHAFDTTGSQFDKYGNMVNWWTDEDRAAFKERTDSVAAYYSGIEVLEGERVRGDLTIGETVADLGALACALDIMRGMEQPDYKAFFRAWANVWAQRITPEARSYMLKYDPHAPGYLRTNVTAQQFDEFYGAFCVKEGDFMFVAPENRLRVW